MKLKSDHITSSDWQGVPIQNLNVLVCCPSVSTCLVWQGQLRWNVGWGAKTILINYTWWSPLNGREEFRGWVGFLLSFSCKSPHLTLTDLMRTGRGWVRRMMWALRAGAGTVRALGMGNYITLWENFYQDTNPEGLYVIKWKVSDS